MRKFSVSDIALNVIRFGLVAAIALTVILHFTSNGATTTISLPDENAESSILSNSAETADTASSGMIDINTATAEQLTALDGIGETKAAAIITYRDEHGAFSSVDELLNVKGIGEKLLEGIRADITVSGFGLSTQPEEANSASVAGSGLSQATSGKLDINTATAEQLTALDGIGETKAAAIIAYRNEHGGFSPVDELLNVKGIGEKLLEGIRADITVSGFGLSTQPEEANSASVAGSGLSQTTSGKININTATAEQLTALDGIGETKAAAIVAYRSEHGGFSSVDELLNVKGIGEKLLEGIRADITVSGFGLSTQPEEANSASVAGSGLSQATSGKLDINTATAEQLTTLDGIGETKAAAIIAYRNEHGGFSSVDELLNVKGIGEKTLQNIRKFITV